LDKNEAKEKAYLFRMGVINEMEQKKCKYFSFLYDCCEKKYSEYILKYSLSGQFAGDFGYLLPLACANYIGAVIILFSSNSYLECQPIMPQDKILTEVPLQLAYSAYGPGHFDATIQIFTTEKSNISDSTAKILNHVKCSCGANHRQLSTDLNAFCKSKRCPCFKNGTRCVASSMCYSCQNGKEKREKSDKRAVTSRKHSYKHASKLTRVSAIASLQKENIPIKTRAWHHKDTFLLMELTRSHPELRQTPMNLVRLYNQFVGRLCTPPCTLGGSKIPM
jgi:hypothetical protein